MDKCRHTTSLLSWILLIIATLCVTPVRLQDDKENPPFAPLATPPLNTDLSSDQPLTDEKNDPLQLFTTSQKPVINTRKDEKDPMTEVSNLANTTSFPVSIDSDNKSSDDSDSISDTITSKDNLVMKDSSHTTNAVDLQQTVSDSGQESDEFATPTSDDETVQDFEDSSTPLPSLNTMTPKQDSGDKGAITFEKAIKTTSKSNIKAGSTTNFMTEMGSPDGTKSHSESIAREQYSSTTVSDDSATVGFTKFVGNQNSTKIPSMPETKGSDNNAKEFLTTSMSDNEDFTTPPSIFVSDNNFANGLSTLKDGFPTKEGEASAGKHSFAITQATPSVSDPSDRGTTSPSFKQLANTTKSDNILVTSEPGFIMTTLQIIVDDDKQAISKDSLVVADVTTDATTSHINSESFSSAKSPVLATTSQDMDTNADHISLEQRHTSTPTIRATKIADIKLATDALKFHTSDITTMDKTGSDLEILSSTIYESSDDMKLTSPSMPLSPEQSKAFTSSPHDTMEKLSTTTNVNKIESTLEYQTSDQTMPDDEKTTNAHVNLVSENSEMLTSDTSLLQVTRLNSYMSSGKPSSTLGTSFKSSGDLHTTPSVQSVHSSTEENTAHTTPSIEETYTTDSTPEGYHTMVGISGDNEQASQSKIISTTSANPIAFTSVTGGIVNELYVTSVNKVDLTSTEHHSSDEMAGNFTGSSVSESHVVFTTSSTDQSYTDMKSTVSGYPITDDVSGNFEQTSKPKSIHKSTVEPIVSSNATNSFSREIPGTSFSDMELPTLGYQTLDEISGISHKSSLADIELTTAGYQTADEMSGDLEKTSKSHYIQTSQSSSVTSESDPNVPHTTSSSEEELTHRLTDEIFSTSHIPPLSEKELTTSEYHSADDVSGEFEQTSETQFTYTSIGQPSMFTETVDSYLSESHRTSFTDMEPTTPGYQTSDELSGDFEQTSVTQFIYSSTGQPRVHTGTSDVTSDVTIGVTELLPTTDYNTADEISSYGEQTSESQLTYSYTEQPITSESDEISGEFTTSIVADITSLEYDTTDELSGDAEHTLEDTFTFSVTEKSDLQTSVTDAAHTVQATSAKDVEITFTSEQTSKLTSGIVTDPTSVKYHTTDELSGDDEQTSETTFTFNLTEKADLHTRVTDAAFTDQASTVIDMKLTPTEYSTISEILSTSEQNSESQFPYTSTEQPRTFSSESDEASGEFSSTTSIVTEITSMNYYTNDEFSGDDEQTSEVTFTLTSTETPDLSTTVTDDAVTGFTSLRYETTDDETSGDFEQTSKVIFPSTIQPSMFTSEEDESSGRIDYTTDIVLEMTSENYETSKDMSGDMTQTSESQVIYSSTKSTGINTIQYSDGFQSEQTSPDYMSTDAYEMTDESSGDITQTTMRSLISSTSIFMTDEVSEGGETTTDAYEMTYESSGDIIQTTIEPLISSTSVFMTDEVSNGDETTTDAYGMTYESSGDIIQTTIEPLISSTSVFMTDEVSNGDETTTDAYGMTYESSGDIIQTTIEPLISSTSVFMTDEVSEGGETTTDAYEMTDESSGDIIQTTIESLISSTNVFMTEEVSNGDETTTDAYGMTDESSGDIIQTTMGSLISSTSVFMTEEVSGDDETTTYNVFNLSTYAISTEGSADIDETSEVLNIYSTVKSAMTTQTDAETTEPSISLELTASDIIATTDELSGEFEISSPQVVYNTETVTPSSEDELFSVMFSTEQISSTPGAVQTTSFQDTSSLRTTEESIELTSAFFETTMKSTESDTLFDTSTQDAMFSETTFMQKQTTLNQTTHSIPLSHATTFEEGILSTESIVDSTTTVEPTSMQAPTSSYEITTATSPMTSTSSFASSGQMSTESTTESVGIETTFGMQTSTPTDRISTTITIASTSDDFGTTIPTSDIVLVGDIKITEGLEYEDALSDESTTRYKNASDTLDMMITNVYRNSDLSENFVSADTFSFRQGSVIATFLLRFNGNLSVDDIANTFREGMSNTSFVIDPSFTSFTVIDQTTISNTITTTLPTTTKETEKETVIKYRVPSWAIGVIIAAGIVIVFLLLLGIALCCMTSSKETSYYTVPHSHSSYADSNANGDFSLQAKNNGFGTYSVINEGNDHTMLEKANGKHGHGASSPTHAGSMTKAPAPHLYFDGDSPVSLRRQTSAGQQADNAMEEIQLEDMYIHDVNTGARRKTTSTFQPDTTLGVDSPYPNNNENRLSTFKEPEWRTVTPSEIKVLTYPNNGATKTYYDVELGVWSTKL